MSAVQRIAKAIAAAGYNPATAPAIAQIALEAIAAPPDASDAVHYARESGGLAGTMIGCAEALEQAADKGLWHEMRTVCLT